MSTSVSLVILPHFDIICDLLLNRYMYTVTWNLFVFYVTRKQMVTSSVYLSSTRSQVKTNHDVSIIQLIIRKTIANILMQLNAI